MLLNAAMAQEHEVQSADEDQDEPQIDDDLSFEEMLAAVGRHKDRAAFVDLFEHFAPRIKSFLIKAGITPETADELAQETMLTIWNKAESYNPAQAAASTWIFTIARNKRIDLLRKNGRRPTESMENVVLEDDSPSANDMMTRRQEASNMAEAMNALPEDQLMLIKKSFYEDKSHAVIAKETGIPLGTVKSRIRLALQRLRKDTGVKALWNS